MPASGAEKPYLYGNDHGYLFFASSFQLMLTVTVHNVQTAVEEIPLLPHVPWTLEEMLYVCVKVVMEREGPTFV